MKNYTKRISFCEKVSNTFLFFRREMLTRGLWRKKFVIIMFIGILFTSWFFIMYGVILGSLLCSKLPTNCRVIDSLVLRFPGLEWRQHNNEHNRIF